MSSPSRKRWPQTIPSVNLSKNPNALDWNVSLARIKCKEEQSFLPAADLFLCVFSYQSYRKSIFWLTRAGWQRATPASDTISGSKETSSHGIAAAHRVATVARVSDFTLQQQRTENPGTVGSKARIRTHNSWKGRKPKGSVYCIHKANTCLSKLKWATSEKSETVKNYGSWVLEKKPPVIRHPLTTSQLFPSFPKKCFV